MPRLNRVESFLGGIWSDGFSSLISLDSLGRESVLSLCDGSEFHNSWVNSASNAVLHLDVEFRNDVGFKGSVFFKILLGGSIDDVADGEALDSLILGTESAAVDADNVLDVPSVVFVSTVISTFDGHVVNILFKIYSSQILINIHANSKHEGNCSRSYKLKLSKLNKINDERERNDLTNYLTNLTIMTELIKKSKFYLVLKIV